MIGMDPDVGVVRAGHSGLLKRKCVLWRIRRSIWPMSEAVVRGYCFICVHLAFCFVGYLGVYIYFCYGLDRRVYIDF